MRVRAGRLEDLPRGEARAVGDGSAVVVRLDGDDGVQVAAFANRCLHKALPLAGGRARGGVLACPQHFWQYRLPDGRHEGGRGCLTAYAVEVGPDGEVSVEVPDAPAATSLRERLLAHARTWDRDA